MNTTARLLFWVARVLRGLRRRIRNRYYRCLLRKMGSGCEICEGVFIAAPQNVSLGSRVTLNREVIFQPCDQATIDVGDDVCFSYRSIILTGGIDLGTLHHERIHATQSIVIEDRAWIGAGAIILPGVTVGRGAVVGAGAVVTGNVAPHTMVAGVPAKLVRILDSLSQAELPRGGADTLRDDRSE